MEVQHLPDKILFERKGDLGVIPYTIFRNGRMLFVIILSKLGL